MMYKVLRYFLFMLSPEVAHWITLSFLNILNFFGLLKIVFPKINGRSIDIMGLSFNNPVGIAAGLDKNGDYIDCLAALGVGFIEVGAVTPKSQYGNPKPRLFRIKEKQALINRMGFNNKGIDYVVKKLKQRKTKCIVGVNLSKNKETPLTQAHEDYIFCLTKIYPYADFVTLNISSPNTPGLRELQAEIYLINLLTNFIKKRNALVKIYNKSLPVLIKIAPDLTQAEVQEIVSIAIKIPIEGIIVTNTSIQRPEVSEYKNAHQSGGLSGTPIKELSTQILQWVIAASEKKLAVIAVGGIDSVNEATKRFQAGANLIQIYTGLVYQGPKLVREIILKSNSYE
ncbi:MAG: dihydroorotate dehydrogenase (quinone) [Gammaproteobacteria bacterium RIFCSPHIGHO2_12_FULL_35_23]|nr:MAG: dihydroorotate dehydrogenase (quinone) [Gammaproteobacteria bacterium RIFCSPHIGHO2_12_FULL_35_23]